MHRDCAAYIATCPGCQVYKNFPGKPAGQMQPITVPPYRWHTVTTDYVTGLPETDNGHDAIAVFVDKLTKYVYLMPCKTTSNGEDWADLFMASVYVNEGMPDHILSDRGPQFRGEFNQGLAKRLGITWDLTSPYIPSSNGMTERTNRTVEGMLRQFVSPEMVDGDTHLNLIQFAINNAWQETVQNTPFNLNRGRHPKTPLTAGLTQLNNKLTEYPASAEYVQKMQQLTARARKCMLAAQQRQKRYYDQRHVQADHDVGADVLLSTRHLKLKVLSVGSNKLMPKWVGPFKVLKRIGPLAYRLDLPDSMKTHNVWHVTYLKAYKTDGRCPPPPLPEMIDGELEFEVDRILQHCVTRRGTKQVTEYLIRWKGHGPEHDFWQDDVENTPEHVKKYWDKKPESERLHVSCLRLL